MDGISVEVPESPDAHVAPPSPGKGAGDAADGKDGKPRKDGGGEDFAATVRELREQVKAQSDQIADLKSSEQVWFERYEKLAQRSGKPTADEEEPEDEDEPAVKDDTPDKLVDEFSSQGVAALVKRGVLTRREAKELIRREAERVAREVVGKTEKRVAQDSALFGKYPELRDQESPLYKRTAQIFREIVKEDPEAAKSSRALAQAAREAKLQIRIEQLEKGGGNGGGGNGRDDEDRQRRIDAQSGDRGGGRANFDNDDELGPETREVLRAMERYGVTEDEFRKERGKVMAGRRQR